MSRLTRPERDENEAIEAALRRDRDSFEASAAQFAQARRGRPRVLQPKMALSIRLDPDIVTYFKAGGPGWQSRINAALRQVMERAMKAGDKPEEV